MRFDPSRFGLRHQLLGLFGLFLVTGALVLALDEVGQHYTQRSMSAMRVLYQFMKRLMLRLMVR